MNDELVEKVIKTAEELKQKPEKWGWAITGVLYGHGKVTVQAVTPKGKTAQFTRKVRDA